MITITAVTFLLLGLHLTTGANIQFVDRTTISTDHIFKHKNVLEVNNRETIVFALKACSDGHIALMRHRNDHRDEEDTEVVLGGWHNTETFIRRRDTSFAWLTTPNILHCAEYRYFWITWKYGRIEVGEGTATGQHKLLSAERKGDLDHRITAIGFSTGFSWTGLWEIPENQGKYFQFPTPNVYGYNYAWKSMDTKNEFYSFRVAACHDAHVAMATEMGMPLYEVFIGGHENTRSCIRLYEHRRDLACTTEDHEHLHCHRLRSFWISWVDGLIKVGDGELYDRDMFLNYTVTSFEGVNALSFSTGWDAHGVWELDDDMESKYAYHTESSEHTSKGEMTAAIFTPKQKRVHFRLHACNNAIVGLYRDPDQIGYIDGDDYFFHIGEDDNTKTRLYRGTSVVSEVDHGDLLSCRHSLPFWISWEDTRIQLGEGAVHGHRHVMDYEAEEHHHTAALSLSKTGTHAAVWYMHRDEGTATYANTTDSHKYKDLWRTVQGEHFTIFTVKACKNAHVVLAERDRVTKENAYEILIGRNNEETVIKDKVDGGDEKHKEQTPNILNCDEHYTFWVGWLSRHIKVGKGHKYNRNLVISLEENIPHEVNAITFASPETEANWMMDNERGGLLYMTTVQDVKEQWLMKHSHVTWFYFMVYGGAAHITLAAKHKQSSEAYHIRFGGDDQKITLHVDDIQLSEETRSDMLHEEYFKEYWVGFGDGIIEFGKGLTKGLNTYLSVQDSTYTIESIGFSSESSKNTTWKLYKEDALELSYESLGTHDLDQLSMDVKQLDHVIFTVKACSNAIIGLAAIPFHFDSEHHAYQIIIEDDSGLTKITVGHHGNTRASVSTSGLLDCNEDRGFWLTWKEGNIALGEGKEHGKNTIISYHDLSPFLVTSLGVSSASGTAQWRLPVADSDFAYLELDEPEDDSTSGLSAGEAAGVIIGCALLVAIFVAVVYIVMRPPDVLKPFIFPSHSGSAKDSPYDGQSAPTSFSSPVYDASGDNKSSVEDINETKDAQPTTNENSVDLSVPTYATIDVNS